MQVVDRKDMEYSYNDGDLYYFMDMETYEMMPVGKDVLGDNFKFVLEKPRRIFRRPAPGRHTGPGYRLPFQKWSCLLPFLVTLRSLRDGA
mgnify:CR=1 FL=1